MFLFFSVRCQCSVLCCLQRRPTLCRPEVRRGHAILTVLLYVVHYSVFLCNILVAGEVKWKKIIIIPKFSYVIIAMTNPTIYFILSLIINEFRNWGNVDLSRAEKLIPIIYTKIHIYLITNDLTISFALKTRPYDGSIAHIL